ncbi:flavodoxin family protein [Collinsella sp. An2]|uniref:flavodoxin family protein n=1 Tax=Collinsella sp. An2 TaxID=1965585 RepID=UPI000B39F76E|nr:flavodoxin family protein [Collinsella sp. An2]OUP10840.1 FMN reductase [Collinsella sp. An2]
MNIVILQGSPNHNGSTAMLVEEFARGAREAGHAVERIDVCAEDVNPCHGCVACGYGARPCVQRDGMARILDRVLAADMLVLATPLYYYGMTAQLKAVIDRFCSENSAITAKRLRSALITVAWNADDWTFEALVAHYRTLVRYLDFKDAGMVLGYGCGTPGMTKASGAMLKAYELGLSLE